MNKRGNIHRLQKMVEIPKKNTFFFFCDMRMVIHPYFSFRPVDYGVSIWSNNASIFSHKDKSPVKNVVCNIVQNTISAIIWVFTCLPRCFGYRFAAIVKYRTAQFQRFELNPIRAQFCNQFIQFAHALIPQFLQ